MALKAADYGYIMENGKVVLEGTASDLAGNEDVKEFSSVEAASSVSHSST